MRHLQIIGVMFCVLGTTAPGAPASTPSPSPEPMATSAQAGAIALSHDLIDAMLRTGHADQAWFSQGFLAQVPATKVDQVIESVENTLGAYERVEFTPRAFVAHFVKGTDDILIRLDAENKIDALLFRPPVMGTGEATSALGLERASHALEPSSGTLSYVITEDGRQVELLNASAPLAVGSAFKLAVLNALRDEVNHGRRNWADVVPLREAWKSLPSGVIRTWPSGTPITNTLVHLLGPQALQPYALGNVPFLTTP